MAGETDIAREPGTGTADPAASGRIARNFEILLVSTRLGLTSFGGPIAHLGYFREEYVTRRKWLRDDEYADLVALCQFLPGPASSQVGISVGLTRAGFLGGFLAWLGFTMPSAIAMIAFAYGVSAAGGVSDAAWLHGLKIVAVAVVALAVWGMAGTLCPDRARRILAILAAIAMLAVPSALSQIGVIAAGGVLGWLLLRPGESAEISASRRTWGRPLAIASLVLFAALLVGLPLARPYIANQSFDLFDSMYRAGSLVFGGGHVVLPLLRQEVVTTGWISQESFVAGYGFAQAVPGPLFTFSAYLGASIETLPARWMGGLLALGAIYLPSFLLVTGTLPFWDRLRRHMPSRRAIMGINAAVVGLLVAALYDPIWTSAIHAPKDLALGLAAFALLAFWKVPPWIVVALAAAGGWAIAAS